MASLLVLALLAAAGTGLTAGCAGAPSREAQPTEPPVLQLQKGDYAVADHPLDAIYLIEGQEVRLLDGRAETKAAPGSAIKVKTSVFGKPTYGDLDDDGQEDAVLLLEHDPGGSGTFRYVAAALNVDSGYRGTNAVLLGDRVTLHDARIRNGVVIASYATRGPDEPMSSPPSVSQTQYLILRDGELKAKEPLAEGEQVFEGWVTIGHEVRSFVPCSGEGELWLLGPSPALEEIVAAARTALPDARPYTPIFMVLGGSDAPRPTEGFGADYKGAFYAAQLVRVSPRGNCRSELIVVRSPSAGAVVSSPLRIEGRARGVWFFEGDFPVVLEDARGRRVAEWYVTAKGEWMTDEFVPFEGTIEFKKPDSGVRGRLVLKKDNPTGLPKHDDEIEIPIFFE